MTRFLLRDALVALVLGGLLFPASAAAVETTPLSEPADPVPVAGLINTSPAAQRDPSSGRLTGDRSPDWRYRGLLNEKTWARYGLRPPAFAVTGTRPSDPAAFPRLKVSPVSRSRPGVSTASRRRGAPSRKIAAAPAAPAATLPKAVAPAASVPPSPVIATPAPAPAATSLPAAAAPAPPAQPSLPYSGPVPAVGAPSPVMPQSVTRGAVSSTPPAPGPRI